MTIFRVEHKKDYTVINNYICKDKRLSWKAKGIWLYAFSRKDNWTFNLVDLINQSTDGKDSVSAGLKELEKCGYLERSRKRDSQGRLVSGADWVFYEVPTQKEDFEPKAENPVLDKPAQANPPLVSTEAKANTEAAEEVLKPKVSAAAFEKLTNKCKQLEKDNGLVITPLALKHCIDKYGGAICREVMGMLEKEPRNLQKDKSAIFTAKCKELHKCK